MQKRLICAATLSSLALLSGCYESSTDLLGDQKETITLAEPVFAYNDTVVHFEGTGQTVKLCSPQSKAEFAAGCATMGDISLKRTLSGNYIIQKSKPGKGGYHYGIWHRSYTGDQGGAGRQCIEWFGQGITGESLEYGRRLPSIYADFVQRVLRIAPSKDLTKDQLMPLAYEYESRFKAQETCLGSWVLIMPQTVVIEGDRRHLRAFD